MSQAALIGVCWVPPAGAADHARAHQTIARFPVRGAIEAMTKACGVRECGPRAASSDTRRPHGQLVSVKHATPGL
jgi:hypothetical protein